MRTQLIKKRLPEISYGISWQASEVLVRFYMESHGRQLKFSKKTLAAKLLNDNFYELCMKLVDLPSFITVHL